MPISERLRTIENKFPSSFLGFIFAIGFGLLSVYLGFYKHSNPQLNYLITSSSGVLDIKEELGNLDVLYKGKSLSSNNQDLQVITLKVINQGDATITNNSYDVDLPLGFSLKQGLLAEEPQITNTSSKYIKDKLSLFIENDTEVTFSNLIIEPEEFFEIKVLILYEVGKKPHLSPIGKIANVTNINIYNDYVSKLNKVPFWERMIFESTPVQILRLIIYGTGFFLFLILIISISEAIGNYKESKRKKKLLFTFKSYNQGKLSRKDELFFETYLSKGIDGLKLISGIVNDQEFILKLTNKDKNEEHSNKYNKKEIDKANDLIGEEIITIEKNRVRLDLDRIQVLTDFILYLERSGEDVKAKYHSSNISDLEVIEDFSKQMSSLKSDQLKMHGSVAVNEKNFSKAIEYFEEYLEHCPNDFNVFWKLAYAKKHIGDLSQAIELIEKALTYSDKHSYLLHYNYACYLALDNQSIDKIIGQLTTALDLDKDSSLKSKIIKDPDLRSIYEKSEFTSLLEKYNIQFPNNEESNKL